MPIPKRRNAWRPQQPVRLPVTKLSATSWEVHDRGVCLRVRNLYANKVWVIQVAEPVPPGWVERQWTIAFSAAGTGTSLHGPEGEDPGFGSCQSIIRRAVHSVIEHEGIADAFHIWEETCREFGLRMD